jgi:hypothetical protein
MASDSFGGFTNTLPVAAYYGIARVALDHLWFDETAPDARTVDPDNVIRLLRMFEDGQCDRLAADHYMSATISTEIMARALERGNLSRESLQSPEPAFLPLEGDERVIGIRGIHIDIKPLSNISQTAGGGSSDRTTSAVSSADFISPPTVVVAFDTDSPCTSADRCRTPKLGMVRCHDDIRPIRRGVSENPLGAPQPGLGLEDGVGTWCPARLPQK